MDLSMKYLLDIGDVFCATIIRWWYTRKAKHKTPAHFWYRLRSCHWIALQCKWIIRILPYYFTSLWNYLEWNGICELNLIHPIVSVPSRAPWVFLYTHTATICDAHVMTCAVWIWIYGKPHIWLLKSNNCLELSLGQFIFIIILPSKLPGIWLYCTCHILTKWVGNDSIQNSLQKYCQPLWSNCTLYIFRSPQIRNDKKVWGKYILKLRISNLLFFIGQVNYHYSRWLALPKIKSRLISCNGVLLLLQT